MDVYCTINIQLDYYYFHAYIKLDDQLYQNTVLMTVIIAFNSVNILNPPFLFLFLINNCFSFSFKKIDFSQILMTDHKTIDSYPG